MQRITRRFCTWKFLMLVKKANRLFGLFDGTEVTFSKTGATLYHKNKSGKTFVTHEQFSDEEKEAYHMNGDRIFTLTFNQVAGCYWEAK